MHTTKMFGLRIKGTEQLLEFDTESNAEGEFCTPTMFKLERTGNGNAPWLVADAQSADRGRLSTQWYAAGYTKPNHEFAPDDLEVVEITISVTV